MCNHPGWIGGCPDCEQMRAAHRQDWRLNWRSIRQAVRKIKRYVDMYPGCTAQDMYEDQLMGLGDIPMYLALHRLVEDFELRGPSPYAGSQINARSHEDWVYYPLCIAGSLESVANR